MRWVGCLVWGLCAAPAWAVGTVEADDPEAGVLLQPVEPPCDGRTRTDMDGNVVSCDPVSTEFLRLKPTTLPPPTGDLAKTLEKARKQAEKDAKKARKRAKKTRG